MNEELLEAVTAKVMEKLKSSSGAAPVCCPRALLLGTPPGRELGYQYVDQAPYEAVIIGSLTAGQLLCFREERVLEALLAGKPVYLYSPGLPMGGSKNRHLEAELTGALSRLRSWGILVTDGNTRRRLVTAQEARQLKQWGQHLPADCILTPSAKDILE